jgi:hypothetical protein
MSTDVKTTPLKRGIRKFFIWLLVIVVAGFAIYYGISNITYSEGSRAGTLIKISKKGYVFKTYEGELALSGVGGYIIGPSNQGNVWAFSAKNKKVYEDLSRFEGKQVSLNYKEKMRTFPWLGETRYFVYSVELINEPETK